MFLDSDGTVRYLKIFPFGEDSGDVLHVSRSTVIYKSQSGDIITLCIDSEGQASETTQVVHPGEENADNRHRRTTTAATGLFTRFQNGPLGVVRKRSVPRSNSLPSASILFSGFDNGNAIISWQSEVGATYQVQKSTMLDTWEEVGLPITGS